MNDDFSRILQKRASILSQVNEDIAQQETENKVLVFKLLPEYFAIPAGALLQAMQAPEIAHMPGMPPYLTGVFQHKGKILPAFNLKLFFQFPKPGLTALDKLLLVQTSRHVFGLIVDEVVGLQSLQNDELRPGSIDNFGGIIAGVFKEHIALLDTEILVDQLFGPNNAKL